MRILLLAALLLLAACGYEPTPTDIRVAEWADEERTGGIMFVGDSITEAWPAEYLPAGAYNRGISGNTTRDVLGRTWLIIEEAPVEMYLMIGINNLHEHWAAGTVPVDIKQILEEVRLGSPDTAIHILLLTPSRWIPEATVAKVNDSIVEMLADYPDVSYTPMLDLFREDGVTINTIDGTHPDETGYRLMYERIQ